MFSPESSAQRFGPERAAELALERYGLRRAVRELPSYIDENYLFEGGDGAQFVLKLAHTDESGDQLAAQNAAMATLAAAGLAVPVARPDRDGSDLGRVRDDDGHERFVRLLTYLPGQLFAETSPRTPELFVSLGRFLGELDRELAEFPASALGGGHRWDLLRALEARTHLGAITDANERSRVDAGFERFEREALPDLEACRRSVIHNDANDYNILVSEGSDPRVQGLIDFGDMLCTATVCEPAIAMTYAMLGEDDPAAACAAVLTGYQREYPLDSKEIALIPRLIEARLCVSVTLAAHERARRPDNEYLSVTEEGAWRLLDSWASGERELAAALAGVCHAERGVTR